MDGGRTMNSLVEGRGFQGMGGGGGKISSKERLAKVRARELCESRGGRPGLSVLTSLVVSVRT